MEKKKISEAQNKKLELICIGVVIIFALVSFLFTKVTTHDVTYKKVSIYVGDANVWQCDIDDLKNENIIVYADENNEIFVKDINDIDGSIKEKYEYNIIEINDKKISCVESNCPNKICISHGVLNFTIDNDMIICAPHKMTVIYE